MTAQQNDLLIVGEGLSALCFLWLTLSKSPGLRERKILIISRPDLCPPCSLRTASIVSQQGIDPSLSPLGEQLEKSWILAKEFYQRMPELAQPICRRYFVNSLEHQQKMLRRFKGNLSFEEEAFWINTNKLLDYWRAEILRLSQGRARFVRAFVNGFLETNEGVELKTLEGETILGKKALWCTGAYTNELLSSVQQKKSIGQFLCFEGSYLKNSSPFILTLDEANAAFSPDLFARPRLIVGAVNPESEIVAPARAQLRKIYSNFQAFFPDFNWPSFDLADVVSGARSKAPKRRPYWGKISEHSWSIHGTYKNGASFCFLAAEELAPLISQELES